MKRFLSAVLASFIAFAGTVTASVKAYAGPAIDSVKGFLTPAEISRSYVSALGSSTAIGFAVAFLTTLGTDAQASSSAGIGVAFVAFLAIHAADLLRRLDHGKAPVPAPSPATDPEPHTVAFSPPLETVNRARKAIGLSLLSDLSQPGSIEKSYYRGLPLDHTNG